jgi:hypothetical protein
MEKTEMEARNSGATPGAPAFNFQRHGRGTKKQGRFGDFVIKAEYRNRIETWTPSWNHTTTVARFLPVTAQENGGELTGYRLSGADDHFDDWVRGYPAVRNFGATGLTMLLYDPRDETYDPRTQNPCWVLYHAVQTCVDAGQAPAGHWAPLLKGGQGRGAQLKRPQDIYLAQCALMQHKDKTYSPPRGGAKNDDLVVLEMGPSCWDHLAPLLNERKSDAPADSDNWEEVFVHGNPIALEPGCGRFITFYQAGGTADPDFVQQAQSSFGGDRDPSGGRDKVFGYGCSIYTEWNGTSADLSAPEVADMFKEKVMPWDEILYIPSEEKQAELLGDAFPADVIEFAFRDHPEWISEKVRRKLAQTTTVAQSDEADTADTTQALTETTQQNAPETGFGAVRRTATAADAMFDDTAARPGTTQPDANTVLTEVEDVTVPDGIPASAEAAGQQSAPRTRSRGDIIDSAREAMRGGDE